MSSKLMKFNAVQSIDFVRRYLGRRFDGHIDLFTGDSVAGWIKLRGQDGPVTVSIFINGSCVARKVVAELFRIDLANAGFGAGRHGFEIPVNVPVPPDGAVNVSVYVEAHKQAVLSRRFEHPVLSRAPDNRVQATYEVPAAVEAPPVYRAKIDVVENGELRGWAVRRDKPDDVFDVEILVDGLLFTTTTNDQPRGDLRQKGISGGLGGIRLALPVGLLEYGSHTVALRAPDGKGDERSVAVAQRGYKFSQFPRSEKNRQVSVIVPIFNAYDDLKICIERLRRYTSDETEIILVDDCSTDNRVQSLLNEVTNFANYRILRNDRNLGFTHSVNRGIAAAGENDVVLLNSDARVTPRWLVGLRTAALSSPRIATVTAMSDRAGAFSAPRQGNDNELPPGVTEASYARAFRRRSLGHYPVVPTGNGFCMYVTRASLTELGGLDAEAFPRGYGEENDFCMRARRAGWRNIIDDRTYVFHDRSKSFGAEKEDLLAAGRAVIDRRYPEYKQSIQVFGNDDKIELARFRARLAQQDCLLDDMQRPRMLFVTSTTTGGTPQTNRDLMEAISDSVECWNLRCDSRSLELSRLRNGEVELVNQYKLEEVVDPITHASEEYDAVVKDWLLVHDFDLVHIRHLAWHGVSLPRIAKELEIKVVFSFHDYYAVSPTIKMIDDTGEFLGNTFFPEGSRYRQSMWPKASQPVPTGEWLRYWQDRFQDAIAPSDAFVTTSPSAKRLIAENLPRIPAERITVIPHGRNFRKFSSIRKDPKHGDPIRILVPGNIDQAKGLDVICALTEFDNQGLLEFHILGNTNLAEPERYSRIVAHGSYQRDEFAEKAEHVAPYLGAVFSVWDETYCHTLTELWSIGVPAIVFDFPTVAGRVRASGAGWVVEHRDIPQLYESILSLAYDGDRQSAANLAIAKWQATEGVANTTALMASKYQAIYREVLSKGLDGLAKPARHRVALVRNAGVDRSVLRQRASRWIDDITQNALDRDIVYIPMSADSLTQNIVDRQVDFCLIQASAVPINLTANLISTLAEHSIGYALEWDLGGVFEGRFGLPDPTRDLIRSAAHVIATDEAGLADVRPVNADVSLFPLYFCSAGSARKRRPERTGPVCALYVEPIGKDEHWSILSPTLQAIAAQNRSFQVIVTHRAEQHRPEQYIEDWIDCVEQNGPAGDLAALARRADFAIVPEIGDVEALRQILTLAEAGLPVLAAEGGVGELPPGTVLVPHKSAKWKASILHQIELNEAGRASGEAGKKWVQDRYSVQQLRADLDGRLRAWIEEFGRRQ